MILECLSAQLYVNNLSDDVRATISSNYLSQITASDEEIINEIAFVSERAFGKTTFSKQYKSTLNDFTIPYDDSFIKATVQYPDGTYDVIMERIEYTHGPFGSFVPLETRKLVTYESMKLEEISKPDTSGTFSTLCGNTFKTKSRQTIVNKGNCSIDLGKTLSMQSFADIPDVNSNNKESTDRAREQATWFNDKIANKQIDFQYIKDLAEYAAGKGKTVRQLLDENGFNTSNLPKDTYLVSHTAYGKQVSSSWDITKDKADALFKGINIDKLNAKEEGVKF